MLLPSPQIAIGLLLISIGIVVTFDIKIDLFKSKEQMKKSDIWENIYIIDQIIINLNQIKNKKHPAINPLK